MSATIEPAATGTRGTAGADDVVRHATLPEGARRYAVSIPVKARYDNWIGGKYAAPAKGQYFSNPSPITGQHLCDIARSTAEDVERALDAAHAAAPAWGKTSPAERANILTRIADRVEQTGRGVHLPEPRARPGGRLRPLHGARDPARRGDPAGAPPSTRRRC